MEIENVNAKANAGLATGIIGTSLAVLGGLGGLGLAHSGVMTGRTSGTGSDYVTKDELKMSQELAAKDATIALLSSENNTEKKIADVYERLATRILNDERAQADWNTAQAVNNATISASVANLQASCAAITKLVVPNSSVCPGWGNVTITPATSGTGSTS